MNRPDDATDDGYVPDKDDPDYPLSEAAGYAGWEPPERAWLRPLILAISLLVAAAMVIPLLLQIGQ